MTYESPISFVYTNNVGYGSPDDWESELDPADP